MHLSHDHFADVENNEVCLICVVENPEIPIKMSMFLVFIPILFINFLFLNLLTPKHKLTFANKDPPFL